MTEQESRDANGGRPLREVLAQIGDLVAGELVLEYLGRVDASALPERLVEELTEAITQEFLGSEARLRGEDLFPR